MKRRNVFIGAVHRPPRSAGLQPERCSRRIYPRAGRQWHHGTTPVDPVWLKPLPTAGHRSDDRRVGRYLGPTWIIHRTTPRRRQEAGND